MATAFSTSGPLPKPSEYPSIERMHPKTLLDASRQPSPPPLTGTLPELLPIKDMSNSRPPSPATLNATRHHGNPDDNGQKHHQDQRNAISWSSTSSSSETCLTPSPAFLEPAPELDNHRINYDSVFRPHFFAALKEKYRVTLDRRATFSAGERPKQQHRRWPLFSPKIPLLQIPVPRRSSQMPVQPVQPIQPAAIKPADPDKDSAKEDSMLHDMSCFPMSPTMEAASAAAAAAAVQHHPGSTVAESFMAYLRLSSRLTNPSTPPPCSLSSSSSTNDTSSNSSSDDEIMGDDSLTERHSMALDDQQKGQPISLVSQKTGLDHTMFLTKNAHIKRPRNAWIHFRCHYGQALKTQDPTLRAEEISKRASRRWARLTEKEKKPWHDLAEQEKQAHKEAFPEYRYCPKRHSSASSSSSSSTCAPATAATTGGNTLVYSDSHAERQPDGDTGADAYKKARRRTK